MQPFEKHQADVGSLESCGGELVSEAATSLQNGALTRRAYQPAITNIGGMCAPQVQAAGKPVADMAASAQESLAWAAVVSRYWGTQVQAFNTRVDEITGGLSGQGPDFGVTGTGGKPPDAQDVATAQAAATAEARRQWWQAHGQYVEDGGRQAASILRDGPTGANMATARDAGALPPMKIDAWSTFVKGLQGKVDPSLAAQQGLPGLAMWGIGTANGPAGWLQSWGSKLASGRFAPRDPLTGRFLPFKDTPWWRQSIRALDGDNWIAQPGQAATRARWTSMGKGLKVGGAVLGFAAGGWDQWSRDSGRDDLSGAAKTARVVNRGTWTAAGGYAGAWAGAQVGGAIGTAIGGPVGTVIGGAVGGLVGGIIGSGVGNTVADWTSDAAGAAGDWVSDEGGELVDNVSDTVSDGADKVKDFFGF